ncbi:hypothetical protein [Winogradskyella sp. R77965]|uniref:hypothetical protein n=1 Tax=Winogradskyella sp. R77965 TaxID=3093872 RepID=UPI0037DD318B
MTTNYVSIDENLMETIKNIPRKWVPAENADGEKMEQELVFTFGPRNGCHWLKQKLVDKTTHNQIKC